jgi:hypothetical protein
MIEYVLNEIKTIDIVITTTDIRLLCLISPSSLTRATRHSGNKHIKTCGSRDYDLCVSTELIHGLKINGYIGIAVEDSVYKHFKDVKKNMENNSINILDTLLIKSCVFNNNDNNERIFGTPEIVLIPYNIHKENAMQNYKTVKHQLEQKVFVFDKDDTFIFKPLVQKNIMTKIESYLVANTENICRSMQSYLLFNLWKADVEPQLLDSGMVIPLNDPKCDENNITMDELLITNSYETNGRPPYFNAFENIIMYYKMKENDTRKIGGRRVFNDTLQYPMLEQQEGTIMKNKAMKPKEMYQKNKEIVQVEKTSKDIPIIDTQVMYYSERSGIPVFELRVNKKELPTEEKLVPTKQFGGKKTRNKMRKSVKRTRKNRTRKNKNKKNKIIY